MSEAGVHRPASSEGGSLLNAANSQPRAVLTALRLLRVALALAMTLLPALVQPALAQRKPFDIGPVPGWVDSLTPDLAAVAPAEQVAKGVHYLLSDHQVRIDHHERVVYRHVASKALNERGVESIANIEIRFDPSYQRLTLHAINVRRGAQVLRKLNPAAVKVLQRETELEALIFDGSMSANAFLDDVRVGDVVEYAYSLRGHNPVFGERQFGHFDLQWVVPVARAHARLVWPLGRELHLRHLNDAAAPRVTDGATHREHRWDLRNVAGRQVESDAPAWFDPYPSVQWGEFKDWQAVARWAAPLYRLPERATPKVQAVVAQIAAQHTDPAARFAAALRHVQSDVRYLGVEIGASSHAPSAPELVLERRFGDCKDKTLLTVALLRGLGIEAHPALVNTTLRRAIRHWQASPGAFNHVLVRSRVNGDEVWVDPTRAPQHGALAQIVQADFGPALVVDERSDALVDMAGHKALVQRRNVRAVLDARDGYDKPVQYTVKTVVEGVSADWLRNTLASQSRDNLQKQYVNFYANHYSGVEVAAPMEVADDAARNQLTLTEHYTIKAFWQRSARHQRLEASIEVPELIDYLRQPRTTLRSAPLALNYPVDLTHVTEVMLPARWEVKPDQLHVDDPAFEFHRNEEWKGRTLLLTDRFKSRLDHIAPADVARYSANLEKARQGVSYTLFRNDTPAAGTRSGAGPHWLPAVVGTLAVLGFIALALRVYRWDPQAWPAGAMRHPMPPRGLGGWLMVVAIVVVVSIVRLVRTLVESWPTYDAESWANLTVPGSAGYDPLWVPSLLLALVGNIGLIAGMGLVVLLYLKRRTSLPRVFIAVIGSGFVVSALDLLLTLSIPAAAQSVTSKDWSQLAGNAIGCALWTAYFLRSGRVRVTFVERYAVQPVARPAPA